MYEHFFADDVLTNFNKGKQRNFGDPIDLKTLLTNLSYQDASLEHTYDYIRSDYFLNKTQNFCYHCLNH